MRIFLREGHDSVPTDTWVGLYALVSAAAFLVSGDDFEIIDSDSLDTPHPEAAIWDVSALGDAPSWQGVPIAYLKIFFPTITLLPTHSAPKDQLIDQNLVDPLEARNIQQLPGLEHLDVGVLRIPPHPADVISPRLKTGSGTEAPPQPLPNRAKSRKGDEIRVNGYEVDRSAEMIAEWLRTATMECAITVQERRMFEVVLRAVVEILENKLAEGSQDDIAQAWAATATMETQLRVPRPSRRVFSWALGQLSNFPGGFLSGAAASYLPELIRLMHGT